MYRAKDEWIEGGEEERLRNGEIMWGKTGLEGEMDGGERGGEGCKKFWYLS